MLDYYNMPTIVAKPFTWADVSTSEVQNGEANFSITEHDVSFSGEWPYGTNLYKMRRDVAAAVKKNLPRKKKALSRTKQNDVHDRIIEILLQCWDAGAAGIVYDRNEWREFEERIIEAVKHNRRRKRDDKT